MKIKDLKKGEYFTRKPIEAPTDRQVFIRGEYIRSEKKYECQRFDDICSFVYLKPDADVFTDFVF